MKNFASSEKNYDRQKAVSYIIYMMGGSYFGKCRCANSRAARHLYLHYAEMPRSRQYDCEEKVLDMIEHMSPEFLEALGTLSCETFFCDVDGDCVIHFYTGGFESLQCTVRKNGTFTIIPVRG